MQRGIVYVFTGKLHARMALISLLTLRQVCDLPVVWVSSWPHLELFDLTGLNVSCRTPATQPGFSEYQMSRYLKTQLPELVDFQQTLYLDSDTLIRYPIDGIWDWLEGADLSLRIDRMRELQQCRHATPDEKAYTLSRLPANTPHYNAGVLLFQQNPTIRRLFQCWLAEWSVYRQIDQLAFLRACSAIRPNIKVLPERFNMIDVQEPDWPTRDAAIAHFAGRLPEMFMTQAAMMFPAIMEEFKDRCCKDITCS